MKCLKCGTEVMEGTLFCPTCGNKIEVNNINQEPNPVFNNEQNVNPLPTNENVMPNNQEINSISNNNMNTNNQNINPMPSNQNVNPVTYNNNNNNNKILIIIIAIIAVIGLGVGIYFLTKGSSKSSGNEVVDFEEDYNKRMERENNEITPKISTEVIKLKSGNYLIVLDSKVNKDIDVDCNVEVYNDSTLVYNKEVFFLDYVGANSKGYAILRGYDLEDIEYNKIVPKITARYSVFKTYGDKISHTEEKKDDHILVSTVNNSGVALDSIRVAIIYYDENDKIIGYEDENIYSNLTAGATNFVKIDYPKDESYKDISFTRYEVVTLAVEKMTY